MNTDLQVILDPLLLCFELLENHLGHLGTVWKIAIINFVFSKIQKYVMELFALKDICNGHGVTRTRGMPITGIGLTKE